MPAFNSLLSTPHSQLLSWHGWHLPLPPEWSPVKIDGDWTKGSIMIADFRATRLALRWQTIRAKRFDAEAWSRRAMGGEVGQLMLERSTPYVPSDAWTAGRVFLEPEPPGRDVWVGQSRVSGRVLEVVYPCRTRSRVLQDEILPAVADAAVDVPQAWSIFDLSCTVPAGWRLQRHRLNAGDLTLTFVRRHETLIVRQVGPASLALARQPLERWIDAQRAIWKKLYRTPSGPPLPETEKAGSSVTRVSERRRRFFYLRNLSPQRYTLALHDASRDRIVFIDAGSESLARETLATVGQRSSPR